MIASVGLFMRLVVLAGTARCLLIFLASTALMWPVAASAQTSLVYSFEPDLEGFDFNGGGLTVSLETSGLGATDGSNSVKLEFADFSGFAGALTSNIHPAFNDPLGVDFVRFDFTNTNRFAPEPTDPPTPGVPTFANTSITFFGTLPGNPVPDAQVQFFFSEEPVGDLEPGTHEVDIDLTTGGLNVHTGDVKGYDDYVADGFVPSGFQIYINKSLAVGDTDFAWTVYIDNIRVGVAAPAVPGDYNGNGTVDAADYVLWRDGGPLMNEVADPGNVTDADYTEWRSRFGNASGSGNSVSLAAVPEPGGALAFIIVGAGWWSRKRNDAAR